MNYQQAQHIRNMPSLSELIRREAVYGGQGAVGSVKEALKQKLNVKKRFQAKILGYKEKLDPMNWARMMFGKTGAAVYGRAFGRSEEDIEYFSGRARPIGGRTYKIGETPSYRPVGSSSGSGIGSKRMMSLLNDMYGFLKKTQEQENRRRDLLINQKEEQQYENERRHKELLTAIKKASLFELPKSEGKPAGLGLESIFESFRGMIQGMIDSALKTFEWIKDLKSLVDFTGVISKAMPWLRILGGLAAGTGGIAAAALAAFLTPFMMAATEKEKIRKDPYAPQYRDNPYAMVLRGEAQTEEQAAVILQNRSRKQVPRNQVKMFVDDKTRTDEELKQDLGADRKTLEDWLRTHKKPSDMWQAPTAKIAGTNYGESTVGTATSLDETARTKVAQEARTEFAKTDPRLITIEQSNTTNKAAPITNQNNNSTTVNKLINEGANLKLESKFVKPQESTINNQTVSAAKTRENPKVPLPPVRNQEESFQRMIYYSTRVV